MLCTSWAGTGKQQDIWRQLLGACRKRGAAAEHRLAMKYLGQTRLLESVNMLGQSEVLPVPFGKVEMLLNQPILF